MPYPAAPGPPVYGGVEGAPRRSRPARKPQEGCAKIITAVLLNKPDHLLLQDVMRLSGTAYTAGGSRRAHTVRPYEQRKPLHRPVGGQRPPLRKDASFSVYDSPRGNSKSRGGRRPPPNHDPTKWSWFGEEEQGNGATDTRQGVRSGMDFATTRTGVPLLVVSRRGGCKGEREIRNPSPL